ncbi:hypothetical protein V6Z11_A05G210400 [Gossypium hirsutum]
MGPVIGTTPSTAPAIVHGGRKPKKGASGRW